MAIHKTVRVLACVSVLCGAIHVFDSSDRHGPDHYAEVIKEDLKRLPSLTFTKIMKEGAHPAGKSDEVYFQGELNTENSLAVNPYLQCFLKLHDSQLVGEWLPFLDPRVMGLKIEKQKLMYKKAATPDKKWKKVTNVKSLTTLETYCDNQEGLPALVFWHEEQSQCSKEQGEVVFELYGMKGEKHLFKFQSESACDHLVPQSPADYLLSLARGLQLNLDKSAEERPIVGAQNVYDAGKRAMYVFQMLKTMMETDWAPVQQKKDEQKSPAVKWAKLSLGLPEWRGELRVDKWSMTDENWEKLPMQVLATNFLSVSDDIWQKNAAERIGEPIPHTYLFYLGMNKEGLNALTRTIKSETAHDLEYFYRNVARMFYRLVKAGFVVEGILNDDRAVLVQKYFSRCDTKNIEPTIAKWDGLQEFKFNFLNPRRSLQWTHNLYDILQWMLIFSRTFREAKVPFMSDLSCGGIGISFEEIAQEVVNLGAAVHKIKDNGDPREAYDFFVKAHGHAVGILEKLMNGPTYSHVGGDMDVIRAFPFTRMVEHFSNGRYKAGVFQFPLGQQGCTKDRPPVIFKC